jgi:hypothetical protein
MARARALPGVLDVLVSGPGGPARLVEEEANHVSIRRN